MAGFSRAKERLDARMLAELRNAAAEAGATDPELAEMAAPEWRLHDLRRTMVSGMARLGINLPVIEKVLNHTSGSFAGVVGVYQRHSFAEEKRAALQAWGGFVESLVQPAAAQNVIPLSAIRR